MCLVHYFNIYDFRYHDCDPLKTKLVSRKDQLLPLFVMDILGHWPGLAGFFVAGKFLSRTIISDS